MICKSCGEEIPVGTLHTCGPCEQCPTQQLLVSLANAFHVMEVATAEALKQSRNARGLSLLLKPGEWERRTSGDEADTSGLGQDVAMFLFLMHRQHKEMLEKLADASTNCPSCGRHDFGLWSGEIRELKELRRKIGEWVQACCDDCGGCADHSLCKFVVEMREEAGQ